MKFKINGLYNSESIKYLQSVGINKFSFDFRPRSLNFIQEHVVKSLVSNHFYQGNEIYFHFENEKEFVINKIISDFASSKIYLEFSGDEDRLFVDQFKKNFVYQINSDKYCEDILESEYLTAISFDYDFLLRIYNNNKLDQFVSNFFKLLRERKMKLNKNNDLDNNDLVFILNQNWDNEIFQGIVHYFNFEIYSFNVNLKVENYYRNINLSKIGNYLNYWTSI